MDSKHRPSPDSPIDDFQHRPSPEPTKEPVKGTIKPSRGRRGWIILGAGAVVVGLLAIGIVPRLNQRSELQAQVKTQSAAPSVNLITPQHAPATINLVLPGSVVALNQTTVYARSNGYLRRWLADIGDRVQKGQLLAVIESPEVDQQVAQAQAQLAQAQATLTQDRANLAKGRSDLQLARANLVLAYKTWERYKSLVEQGVVSQQYADTQLANYKTNAANVQSAQNTVKSDIANVSAAESSVSSSRANLQQYQVLQSYEKVTAPFTGIITSRNVDAGALITSGSSNPNTSLYTITAYDTLEVNVYVPQANVPSLQVGQTAQIQVRELPQRVFTGKVLKTTNALDPSSRTLLAQVLLPNPGGAVRPGMYATVKFDITRAQSPLTVADSALVINAGGTQVATVTQNKTVHYQKVQLGRDNGTQTEILSGLNGNESLINNPTVDLVEGTHVQPAAARS